MAFRPNAVYKLASISASVIQIIGSGTVLLIISWSHDGITASISLNDSVDTHFKDKVLVDGSFVEGDVARGIISEEAEIVLDLINLRVYFERYKNEHPNVTMKGTIVTNEYFI